MGLRYEYQLCERDHFKNYLKIDSEGVTLYLMVVSLKFPNKRLSISTEEKRTRDLELLKNVYSLNRMRYFFLPMIKYDPVVLAETKSCRRVMNESSNQKSIHIQFLILMLMTAMLMPEIGEACITF